MNLNSSDSTALAEHADRLIAQIELEQSLEAQVAAIAPESIDPGAARIRLIKRHQVREAINEGEYFWRKKQSFSKLKDFKTWLEQQRFTWKDACRHIKLYECDSFARKSRNTQG